MKNLFSLKVCSGLLLLLILNLLTNTSHAQTDQAIRDKMREWVNYGQKPVGSVLQFSLYCKRSSWGLGQQFYAANVTNRTAYKLRVTGIYYAKLLCGNEAQSKLDFTIKPYETMEKAEMGSMNINFLSDATGLISSADEELCKGIDIVVGGKKYGVNRVQALGLRNIKIEAQISEGGDWESMDFNGNIAMTKPKQNADHPSTSSTTGTPATGSSVAAGVATTPSTGKTTIQRTAVATDESAVQQSEIDRQRYNDSLKNAIRQQRINTAKQTDKSEDASYTAAAAGVVAIAALVQDGYVDFQSNLKLHVGLGYEQLPLVANDFGHNSSSIQVSSFPNVTTGLEARLNLTRRGGIALQLNPSFMYGEGAFSPGESGSSMSYGGTGTLFLAPRANSKIQLFAEGSYFNRSGTWSYDLDAASASLGTSYGYTDVVYDAVYDYSLIKYGGGIKLQFVSDDDGDKQTETYLKGAVYLEKPSFLGNSVKPLMSANVQFMLSSFVMLDFSYSKNYAVAGTAVYKNNFTKEEKDYFCIKLIRKGLLTPHR